MEEERTRLQKIVLLSLAVMTLAFGILTGVSKLHPGVQFGGTLFQPAQTAEKMTYTGKLRGEKVTISVWRVGEQCVPGRISLGPHPRRRRISKGGDGGRDPHPQGRESAL